MLHVNVRHFVSHHSGELRLIVCRCNRADIHEHWSSRQRKGVDLFLRDDVKLKWPRAVCGNGVHQPFAKRLNILCLRTGIRQDRHLRVHLSRNLQPKLFLLVASHTRAARIGEFRGAGGPKIQRCHQAGRYTNQGLPWMSKSYFCHGVSSKYLRTSNVFTHVSRVKGGQTLHTNERTDRLLSMWQTRASLKTAIDLQMLNLRV